MPNLVTLVRIHLQIGLSQTTLMGSAQSEKGKPPPSSPLLTRWGPSVTWTISLNKILIPLMRLCCQLFNFNKQQDTNSQPYNACSSPMSVSFCHSRPLFRLFNTQFLRLKFLNLIKIVKYESTKIQVAWYCTCLPN